MLSAISLFPFSSSEDLENKHIVNEQSYNFYTHYISAQMFPCFQTHCDGLYIVILLFIKICPLKQYSSIDKQNPGNEVIIIT